jgi:hypothetical protein
MHAAGRISELQLGRGMDTGQLLIRSREAIARFERANAEGNPAELVEARTALESCHAEVKRFVAAKKAMKSEKLQATIQNLATSQALRRSGQLVPGAWARGRDMGVAPKSSA